MKSQPTYKSQTFTGVVREEEGKKKIKINFLSQYQMFVDNMKDNQPVALTVTDRKPLRSVLQNNYYWLFLDLISLSSGHTPEELHLWAKGKFLSKGITEVFGDKVRKVNSSTKLNRLEFCEYICRIEDTTGIEAPITEPFLKPLTHAEYDALKEEQRSFYQRMKSKIFLNQK